MHELRALPGELGFRLFRVWIVRRVQHPFHMGLEPEEVILREITVDGYQPAKVRQLSTSDIYRGAPADSELSVQIQPAFERDGYSYGYTPEELEASEEGDGILFRVTGPGMPEAGALYVRTALDTSKSLAYTLYLRRQQ